MALDLLTLVVVAFVGTRLALAFRTAVRRDVAAQTLAIVRGIRARHVIPVPFVAAAVVTAATLLTQLPVLSFGWWSAVGGDGNPVFGSTQRTSGTVLEWLVPLVFIVLLLPALPLFARREEEIFRLGAETWSTPKRIARAFLFGVVHAVIGIPLGVALALSIGGAWFTLAYLRGYREGGRRSALMESTRAHTAYNAVIVVIVLLTLPAIVGT